MTEVAILTCHRVGYYEEGGLGAFNRAGFGAQIHAPVALQREVAPPGQAGDDGLSGFVVKRY